MRLVEAVGYNGEQSYREEKLVGIFVLWQSGPNQT